MKKGIIIVLAVAIIGVLGIMAKNHHQDGASLAAPIGSSNTGSVQSANTSSTDSTASAPQTTYNDGTYNGASEDTPYGAVQIAVVVGGGKITDVKFLQMPHDLSHSQEVTAFAEPYLKSETIQNQSANIDFVSGATTSSEAYQQSLQAALDKAVVS